MDLKGQKCFRCEKFRRYYVKGVNKFEATDYGQCVVKNQTVNCEGSCPSYRFKKSKPRNLLLLNLALNGLLTQLTEIRKTLEEERNENEEVSKL